MAKAKGTGGRHGLDVDADPGAEKALEGGPRRQRQDWPGSDAAMRPLADHGEESYRGGRKLEGRRALITGGDSGIGRAVAIAFAREGADVAIAYYDEHDDAEETLRWIRDAGRTGIAIPGDLSEHVNCLETVRRTVEALGGLDILVNNAAYQMEVEDITDLTEAQLDVTFRTNIYAYIWMAQAALGHMEEGGVILNTGSVTGLDGHASLVDYACTKGAIHVLTRSLAMQLADRKIRVNCVAPGPVWTPLIPATLKEDHVAGFGADTYWGRPAQPAEIAPSYVFLASADGRYYSGEVFAPTGRGASR
jgi:NAD(P)-dependent dehydrogenase (short-subunit alcohol dehydrogenase family)